MTHVRFNNRNCMPAQSRYAATPELINWFFGETENGSRERSSVRANIVETSDDFRIELAVPGFSKSDFKINLEGRILAISGGTEDSPENKEESYIRREFSRSAFNRSFRLSSWVDSGSIEAKYENGILMVTIPKTEEAKDKPAKEIVIS